MTTSTSNPPSADLLVEHAPLRDRLIDEAQRILSNTRHTKYQHVQFIDEATGTYDVDCSDFVSYALSRFAKHHLALIPKEDWWPVPRAYKYFRFFADLPPAALGKWARIERLEDARPGDIIAWELPGEIREDHDTGHVWIVAETPIRLAADLFAIPACDSAKLAHYDDSRSHSDGTFRDGVGEGTFHLRIDGTGNPIAFQFGPGDRFHEDPIAIGRIL